MIVTSQNSISIQKKFHVINFISKMQKVSRSSSQSLEWGLLQSFCQRGVSNLFFLFWEFAIFRIAETRSFFIHLIHILFSQNSKYEKKSFNSVTILFCYHIMLYKYWVYHTFIIVWKNIFCHTKNRSHSLQPTTTYMN